MGTYLPALKASLRQVFVVAKLLFHGRLMVHIVSYKDYCDGDNLLTTVSRRSGRNDAIVKFVDTLEATGGGDNPEAVKTALNHVIQTVDEIRAAGAPTSRALVFLYTDAPPHHAMTQSSNMTKEIRAIESNPKYRGGHDWFQIQRTLRTLDVPVYTFHSPVTTYHSRRVVKKQSPSFYAVLGPTVILPALTSDVITEASMGVLLQLMGQAFTPTTKGASDFAVSTFQLNGQNFDPTYDAADESDMPCDSLLTLVNEPFEFAPLPYLKEDLDALLPLFRRDMDFRNLVMKTFQVIFRPDNVLAVTYNPIFGKLWRLCCRQRLDPRLDDLTTQLAQCVPKLTGPALAHVQTWLDESYNDTQRIREAIATLEPNGPCFTLDSGTISTSKDNLRSLARAPTPGVLASTQAILTWIQYHDMTPPHVQSLDDDADVKLLPVALADEDFFSFLPNLMFPGLTLSRRGAAIVALVCCLSDHVHLRHRAESYLKAIEGTWLPFEYAVEFPEIFSAEIVELLYRGRAYLTPLEQHVYSKLFVIHRMRLAATKQIEATVGFTPKKDDFWPDRKAPCLTCGYDTSLSLMVSPILCAMCVTYGGDAPALQANTFVAGNESHMVACHDCHGIYAVLQVAQLGTAAKCWFCRTNVPGPPPKTSCTGCLNEYIDPAGLYRSSAPDNSWLCPVCTDAPTRAKTTATTTVQVLTMANPDVAVVHGWTAEKTKDAFVELVYHTPHDSMFKIFTQKRTVLVAGPTANGFSSSQGADVTIRFDGKIVHQARQLCQSFSTIVLPDSLRDVCSMCFYELPLVELTSACGRCLTKVCDPCLAKWYGAPKPGKLIVPAMLSCAFCRRPPTLGVLRKHNRELLSLKVDKTAAFRDPNMHYGWCLGCFRIKGMIARTNDSPIDEEAFVCGDCKTAHPTPDEWVFVATKQCPNCHAPTENHGGCDHVTCI
ncbi:hypothetical protein H310_10593 [Aphanomyces invadans]|uniref:Uncharacterized protein n=1 Tax=Aphanomyces invadans TaxID=157072 RepID=A0A024TPM6_9STRA|nr:hypothetical protein H310_10593 [Aphanomyces invadans]ETV95934.1 hypothetical protein H310_10593 [Aphanomyces invadans]|eukprot:XP_008875245.1 hypothetical protein H310_10593 [Aphanomyces invadans]